MHPTKKALYVGLPDQNQIAVYTFNSAGDLTYSTEVADPGGGVGWLVMNAAGTRLYSAEPDSGTVTVYNTDAPGKPFVLQHAHLKPIFPRAFVVPTNMAFDPTGQFLYVVDQTGGFDGGLHVLHVAADGAVSEPTQGVALGLPAGTVPTGVAALMK